MKLLVIYKSKKAIDVIDKSGIEAAVQKTFKNEIGNRPFKIEYYDKDFEEYIDLESADIEDRGKMQLFVDECLDTGQRSLDLTRDIDDGQTPESHQASTSSLSIRTAVKRQHGSKGENYKESTYNTVGTINHGKMRIEEEGCLTYITANPSCQRDIGRKEKYHYTAKAAGIENHGVPIANYNNSKISTGFNQGHDAGINYEELIKKVNDNTKITTSRSILADFKHEGLYDSDCVVQPQMVDIDVDKFYKGRYGSEYTEDTSSSALSQDEGHKNQLTSRDAFWYQQENISEVIEVYNFMGSIWKRGGELDTNDALGVNAIIASAGSGKTTLTRRMAREALDIRPHDHQTQKMVQYIDLKEIREDESIKPAQFLFGALASKFEQDQVFTWLVQNQSDAIIIFDGFDQTNWHFDQNDRCQIRNDQSTRPSAVLYNILARNILRQVKTFIASREFKISDLPLEARPQRIIALNGLTMEDAKTLFISLLQHKGVELWEKIEAISPRLLHLVCTPVFLVLTAIVMGRDPNRDPPRTVTELYNRIVLSFENVENIRNDHILSILKKLKDVAFLGMQEGRVLFTEKDLERAEVPALEVNDLMSKVPGNKLISSRLLKKDFDFFFCHQSLQEFLAASFVAEMKLDDFSLFEKKHLHGKRWSVVRRFVTGIVCSKSLSELHDGQYYHLTH